MAPLGFYDFNRLLKESFCVLSDSGTTAEEGLYYNVPNVSLRMATERMETLESGATIVSGMDADNIVDAVDTAISQPWSARYDFAEDFSPSSVVVNALRTQITNFFLRIWVQTRPFMRVVGNIRKPVENAHHSPGRLLSAQHHVEREAYVRSCRRNSSASVMK